MVVSPNGEDHLSITSSEYLQNIGSEDRQSYSLHNSQQQNSGWPLAVSLAHYSLSPSTLCKSEKLWEPDGMGWVSGQQPAVLENNCLDSLDIGERNGGHGSRVLRHLL